jgi:hypothetical protein
MYTSSIILHWSTLFVTVEKGRCENYKNDKTAHFSTICPLTLIIKKLLQVNVKKFCILGLEIYMNIDHFENKLVKNYLPKLNIDSAVHYTLYIMYLFQVT